MDSANLRSIEARAFVPARDFELSKRFYQALGFTLVWSTPELAYFRHGPSCFLLQNFHVKQHAENFMMNLIVEDVDAWWSHIAAAAAPFGVTVEPPQDQPWGMRDFTFIDPSGVLWRIGQSLAKQN